MTILPCFHYNMTGPAPPTNTSHSNMDQSKSDVETLELTNIPRRANLVIPQDHVNMEGSMNPRIDLTSENTPTLSVNILE